MRGFFNGVSKYFKGDPNTVGPDGLTQLQRAIRENNLSRVKKLIKDGADVNFSGAIIHPPLHFALFNDRQPIALALIEAKADVNLQDSIKKTPLHYAVGQSQETFVLALLKLGADPNVGDNLRRTPLHMVPTSQPQIIDTLVRNKANINAQDENGDTPLHLFLTKKDMAERLLTHDADPNIRNNKGVSPYAMMLEDGRMQNFPKMLQQMIALKADLGSSNHLGETVLHLAARLEMEDTFLNVIAKTDLTARDGNGNNVLHVLVRMQNSLMIARVLERAPDLVREPNKEGFTPMTELVRRATQPVHGFSKKYVSTARVLLGAKANPDSLDENGCGLLHHAVFNNEIDLLEDLVRHKADLNLTDRKDQTPLHVAIEKKNLAAMDILLDAGADPDRPDARGWTILDRLAEKGDRDSSVVQRLIVAKAQYNKQLPLHPEMMRRPKMIIKDTFSNSPAGPKP